MYFSVKLEPSGELPSEMASTPLKLDATCGEARVERDGREEGEPRRCHLGPRGEGGRDGTWNTACRFSGMACRCATSTLRMEA